MVISPSLSKQWNRNYIKMENVKNSDFDWEVVCCRASKFFWNLKWKHQSTRERWLDGDIEIENEFTSLFFSVRLIEFWIIKYFAWSATLRWITRFSSEWCLNHNDPMELCYFTHFYPISLRLFFFAPFTEKKRASAASADIFFLIGSLSSIHRATLIIFRISSSTRLKEQTTSLVKKQNGRLPIIRFFSRTKCFLRKELGEKITFTALLFPLNSPSVVRWERDHFTWSEI